MTFSLWMTMGRLKAVPCLARKAMNSGEAEEGIPKLCDSQFRQADRKKSDCSLKRKEIWLAISIYKYIPGRRRQALYGKAWPKKGKEKKKSPQSLEKKKTKRQ